MLDLKFLAPLTAELFLVSPDKRKLLTKTGNKVEIRNISSLEVIATFEDSSFKNEQFSFDSKYFNYINEPDSRLKIIEIETENVLEINLKPTIGIEQTLWNYKSEIILYISELEVYIGVYDMNFHRNFTLRGCSSNDFNEPLCSFSPNDDYLCYHKSNFSYVYCSRTWDLVARIKCQINAINLKFVAPYVVFLTNSNGFVNGYSILSKEIIHSEHYLPNECIKSIEISTNGLIAALGSYGNFIVLMETVSFNKICELKYKFRITKSDEINVWEEQLNEERIARKWFITKNDAVLIESIKNINDEFKIKRNEKIFIAFSSDDVYIATYDPGIRNTIWIWNWSEENLLQAVIILQQTKIQAIKWHEKCNLLAVICSDKLVLWFENECCSIVKCKNVNFDWVSKRETLGAISNDSLLQMLVITR